MACGISIVKTNYRYRLHRDLFEGVVLHDTSSSEELYYGRPRVPEKKLIEVILVADEEFHNLTDQKFSDYSQEVVGVADSLLKELNVQVKLVKIEPSDSVIRLDAGSTLSTYQTNFQNTQQSLTQKYKNAPIVLLTGKQGFGQTTHTTGKFCDPDSLDKFGVITKQYSTKADGVKLAFILGRMLRLRMDEYDTCPCGQYHCVMSFREVPASGSIGWSRCSRSDYSKLNRAGLYNCLNLNAAQL
jgi:hypothetical protein